MCVCVKLVLPAKLEPGGEATPFAVGVAGNRVLAESFLSLVGDRDGVVLCSCCEADFCQKAQAN